MSVEMALACKDYSFRRLSISSASASPGCCSSAGALSLDGSQSSGCLSLTCTETDVTDIDLQDVDGLSDDLEELCGSCATSICLSVAPLEKQAAASELCRLIREDLAKQHDARAKPSAAAMSGAGVSTSVLEAPPPRRLPAQHRALIVGWMRQVSSALTLHPATLFSAVSFLDRFVAAAEAPPADGLLQLLALTCMSVAVKYNEVGQVAPSVWLGLAVDPTGRRLYTTRDLQRYEFTLLQAIEWRLHDPTIFTFLEHFLMCQPQPHAAGARTQPAAPHPAAASAHVPPTVVESPVGSRAAMLAEMSLLYDTFLPYDHSAVALACVSLAERVVYGGAAAAAGQKWSLPTAAAAIVAATSGLKIDVLAPGLEPCAAALEQCFAALCNAGAMPQPATARA